jgi:hypothetical protein
MHIWFNLLLFANGHWVYINSYETLEECQEVRALYEEFQPANYYCLPKKMLTT